MLNIENLVINQTIRGTYFDRGTNEVIFNVENLQNSSLECSGEQVFVNDQLGRKLAAFDRSKDAVFSAENALINFGLMAAQFGSDKEIASEEKMIPVPAFELIEVKDVTKIALATEPIEGSLKFIYSTHKDKSKSEKYALGTTASATEFAITGKEITLPTDVFKVGDMVAIWYEKNSAEAMQIVNSATTFAKPGKFVLEVLAHDVCAPEVEYYCYVIFSNSKLDNNVTINFSNEAVHQFTINAIQDYCTANKELFKIVVAE